MSRMEPKLVYVLHWWHVDHSGHGVGPYAFEDRELAEKMLTLVSTHSMVQWQLITLEMM
jgi:hypothetical protein